VTRRDLLIIGADGYGKRTPVNGIRSTKRGKLGVRVHPARPRSSTCPRCEAKDVAEGLLRAMPRLHRPRPAGRRPHRR
jgi:hypothetical protein